MSIINMIGITKEYRRYKKKGNFFSNFFNREYENRSAIKDFDLTINQGEIVGLLGQNGAGKTTLIKIMSGILKETRGTITVDSYIPSMQQNAFKKNISLVLGQKQQMWWDITAMDNFILNKAIYDIQNKKFDKVLNEMLELLNIKKLIHVPVRTLSLGERMKCELVCALLHEPKIIFLDEPTIGLDLVVQENIRKFIKNYRDKHNATIVITSHYMEDIEKMCDRVVFIERGEKYFDGKLEDFIKYYKQEMIISIEVFNIDNFDWSKYGKVINNTDNKIEIIVPKDDVVNIKNKIKLLQNVQSVQSNDLSVREIVRNHFEMRSKI